MRTAIWLYAFLFVAFFDLHAQYPILSPFALSIGAAPSFIGLILGMYSLTHLPGNLLAGVGVDRYGSKPFIAGSLIVAGIVLVFQAYVTEPWELLVVRSVSGFVLAFLSPACLALLAKLADDPVRQGKLMAGNGLVHTLASVVSPAVGAYIVAQYGFSTTFAILGWGLIVVGVFALFGLKENGKNRAAAFPVPAAAEAGPAVRSAADAKTGAGAIPWLFFGIPLAVSCSQGILFFELPLMEAVQQSVMTIGLLFSLVSFGSLITLSLLVLHRISAFARTLASVLAMAVLFFGISVKWPVPLYISLVLIGMVKGVLYPAISTLLASVTPPNRYGRVFSVLSIAYSIGSFIGPVLAGQFRSIVSSYFLAFVVLMIGLSMLPIDRWRSLPNPT